jgi:hypothetical protein
MNYADLKWSIIQEWNSDAKYTNEHLIEMGAEAGIEIKNVRADRKSIIAKLSDGMITVGVESGEYVVDGLCEDCDSDVNFKRYMGDLTIPAPTLKFEDSPMVTFEEMGMPADDDEEYSYEDEEEEELPDFKKMSKKKLDDWALDRGIELDRRKTKAHMIEELNKKM